MDGIELQNLSEAEPRSESIAACPVSFGACAGFFMPAVEGTTSDQAVLFLSPWGFEDLSVRKLWRILAERFSLLGHASLRFDLPSTGNALDLEGTAQLSDWQDTILLAAETLRAHSGASRILLVSHGLGAALAGTVWERLGPLSGVASLAPVLSGRLYMRELALWARMTDGKPDPEKELKEGRGFWISGFQLPDGICADLRTVDLTAVNPPPVSHAFVAARPERPQEFAYGSHLADRGVSVTTVSYDGYDALVSNLNFSEQPTALIDRLIDWAAAIPAQGTVAAPALPPPNPRLEGTDFIETPVRFGAGGRLVGTICEPKGAERKGATVVILSTAYHPSAGWGRIGVGAARRLAAKGIASLRFDSANTGDSPPLPGAPEQILYSPAQGLDVAAAVDLLERRKLMPAIIAGRCSGGYLAFRSLLTDPRLKGAVSANPYTFYWDGSQSVEDLLRFVPKPLGNYGMMLFQGKTWKRIVNGEINLRYAVVNISHGLLKKALHASETVLQIFPFLSREYREVQNAFHHLQQRKAAVSLLYADDDPGVAHLVHYFGEDGTRLSRFDNVSIRFLSGTDHNLSTPEARDVFAEAMEKMAMEYPPALSDHT